MYSPDAADIDPRNPNNWREPYMRYDVRDSNGNEVASFNHVDFANAYVLNTQMWSGDELSVVSVDLESGDEECVSRFEFEGDIGRYVEVE